MDATDLFVNVKDRQSFESLNFDKVEKKTTIIDIYDNVSDSIFIYSLG